MVTHALIVTVWKVFSPVSKIKHDRKTGSELSGMPGARFMRFGADRCVHIASKVRPALDRRLSLFGLS